MKVWVLAYYNTNDEGDNGVLGVYATEKLAREGGIAEAQKDPNLADRVVKWFGTGLRYKADSAWYEVRTKYYVDEWDVTTSGDNPSDS